jgi:hypothetical protein
MDKEMKGITSIRGSKIIVDDSDYKTLVSYVWSINNTGYAVRYETVDNKKSQISMHRQIMNTPRGMFTDHKNHERLDNRRSNLRICTREQNQRNMKLQKNSSTGQKGVYWDKKAKAYRARIYFNKKRKCLGFFSTAAEAGSAYNREAIKVYGDFAVLNS